MLSQSCFGGQSDGRSRCALASPSTVDIALESPALSLREPEQWI